MKHNRKKYDKNFKQKAVELSWSWHAQDDGFRTRGFPFTKRTQGCKNGARHLKKGNQHLLRERWEIYQFINDHRTRFTIEMMCRVFKIGKSSYYSWLKNGPSKRWVENVDLLLRINNIFEYSCKTYGSPRIKEELQAQGIQVSRPRVARIMKAAGIRARKPRRFIATTDSRHNYPVAPNIGHSLPQGQGRFGFQTLLI